MNNIIEIIEAKLQAQKDDIYYKDLIIADLKEKLYAAEMEAAEAHKENDRLKARLNGEGATA